VCYSESRYTEGHYVEFNDTKCHYTEFCCAFMLNFVIRSAVNFCYTDSCYAEFQYTKCHYTERHYAECR
jgi:hypothetical protein